MYSAEWNNNDMDNRNVDQTHSRRGWFDRPRSPIRGPDFYHNGLRCHLVCEPMYPRPYPRNPRRIARFLLGKTLDEAYQIYSNIRVVIRNGERLIITQDYDEDRINVATRNDIITRIVGFY